MQFQWNSVLDKPLSPFSQYKVEITVLCILTKYIPHYLLNLGNPQDIGNNKTEVPSGSYWILLIFKDITENKIDISNMTLVNVLDITDNKINSNPMVHNLLSASIHPSTIKL